MTDVDPNNFFEEDEPIEKIKRAFEHGEKFVTAPPTPRGQTQYLQLPGMMISKVRSVLSESQLFGQLIQHH